MELYVVFRVEHVSYYVYIFEGERFSLKYLYKGVFIAVHDDLSHVPTYLLRQGDLHKCLAYDWKRHFPAFTFFLTVGDSGSCSFNKRRVEKKQYEKESTERGFFLLHSFPEAEKNEEVDFKAGKKSRPTYYADGATSKLTSSPSSQIFPSPTHSKLMAPLLHLVDDVKELFFRRPSRREISHDVSRGEPERCHPNFMDASTVRDRSHVTTARGVVSVIQRGGRTLFLRDLASIALSNQGMTCTSRKMYFFLDMFPHC